MKSRKTEKSPISSVCFLGAFVYAPSIINKDTDIRTLKTGFWIVPATSWGGTPPLIPVPHDGFLMKFCATSTVSCYLYMSTANQLIYGIQWFGDSITWKKLNGEAITG